MASQPRKKIGEDKGRLQQREGSSSVTRLSRNAAQLAVIRSASSESMANDLIRRQKVNAAANHGSTSSRAQSSRSSTIADVKSTKVPFKQREPRDTATDSTPIGPTSSLIGLFEQKAGDLGDSPSSYQRASSSFQNQPDIKIYSPKGTSRDEPSRKSFFADSDASSKSNQNSQLSGKFVPLEVRGRFSHKDDNASIPDKDFMQPSAKLHTNSAMIYPQTETQRPSPPYVSHEVSSGYSLGKESSPTRPVSIRGPSRSDAQQEDTSIATSLPSRSITAQYNQMYPQRITPLSTGDDLANAIVASSLASSRGPSPRRLEPPLPPSRRSKHSSKPFSRTPSPVKHTMLHTLRKAEPSEYEESEDERHPYGKHKKKRIVRKHPNKHHEGDRKRWRDAVTDRERKRYDGVWAANRGLHCSLTPSIQHAGASTGPSSSRDQLLDRVSNLVVREIWSRSRLPGVVLENIWDLVDADGIGRLTKDEFVVGLWLIDQRLKGRKLPVKARPILLISDLKPAPFLREILTHRVNPGDDERAPRSHPRYYLR